MLVIELTFPAGRYHATPWGRHVNEGEAEWPPSPYRLVRAVFDVWKRKRPDWHPSRVEPIFGALASSPPRFVLPGAAVAHTRSFLSKNTENPSDRTLVFDAFAAVSPRAPLLMGWPELDLPQTAQADLDELLSTLNYLGRSESWVSARVLPGIGSVRWNCEPAASASVSGQPVNVACAISSAEYARARNGGEGSWLEALAYSTADLLRDRRSDPPAIRYVEYLRPADCFSSQPTPYTRPQPPVHGVVYELESKVLPQSTSALEIAERVRTKLMGIHKTLAGGPERVSCRFSGKDADGRPLAGHRHMFVLPADRDCDGYLDQLLVVCREPFDHLELIALDRLESLWQPDGKPDIRCVPVRWGTFHQLLKPALKVASRTPFVPTRHYRRGRGSWAEWIGREIGLECERHGLPKPVRVSRLDQCGLRGGRSYRWIEFRRNRKGDSGGMGFGFDLEFAEPVSAPFALGYGCHFGLGQFWPA